MGATIVSVAMAWLILFCISIESALPFNSLNINSAVQSGVRTFVPQGWAFFSRNPREERLAVYQWSGRKWENASLGPLSRASNLFGLDRTVRAQAVELSNLLRQISRKKWQECHDTDLVCLNAASEELQSSVNFSTNPTLCGKLAAIERKPLPWAWRNSSDIMPASVVRVNVRCLQKSSAN